MLKIQNPTGATGATGVAYYVPIVKSLFFMVFLFFRLTGYGVLYGVSFI